MIVLKNISKKFGDYYAVRGVNLQLEKGQTLALIGTSGSGKTTLLKMINRLIEPTRGEVWLEDAPLLNLPVQEVRRKMGYIIQEIGLFPHYTVAENIATVPRLLGWDKARIRQRTHTLMQRLGLPVEELVHQFPHQLSGGQQQRVGIARALAADPPIILMDEPFGALDPITRRKIRADFKQLEELSNKTTIIITHDIIEAFDLADLICLLDQGEIQQLGTAQELLFQPANEFCRQFFKGRFFNLAMVLIPLFQLTPFLKESNTQVDQYLNPIDSVQVAMSRLSAGLTEDHKWGFTYEGKVYRLRLNALLEAFQQLLKQRHQDQ